MQDRKLSKLLDTARQYLGYKSELGNRTTFSARVGYDAAPWAGAFLDVIFRDSGVHVPSCVYTPTALAEFIKSGQLFQTPQPGDIAFFNFSSTAASAFNAPHCGLVTDTREFKSTGKFVTIEGDTVTFKQKANGVYMKTRYSTDVIGFGRPGELATRKLRIFNLLINAVKKLGATRELDAAALELLTEDSEVKLNSLQPGKRNHDVEVIQVALHLTVGLTGATQGTWDAATVTAFTNFQRKIGYVGQGADGIPTEQTLQRLASESGLFKLK